MKKFLLLATFVLLAAVLFSCTLEKGDGKNDSAASGETTKSIGTDEITTVGVTTELGDKNSANGILIPTGYPFTEFPVRLSGNREIKFDASYRDILNLLKTMDGLKICGYGIAGNFPCICVGFSGEDSGIVLKIDPVYTLININNEYCPYFMAVDSAEKYEEDFSSCTKEVQDDLWKWLEDNADRVPTRTYDETPEWDRKPHTPEEFYKTLKTINKDEKSFKYWSRSLIYDYQVLECQSYEEYENKVKNGIICESDRGTRDRDEILWYKRMDLYFYYTYSPADEEYRNDMKTVLSNGAEIRSGMTKNEVKAILSEAGAVSRLPDTLGTGMLAYELIGKDEGFLLMMKFADKKLNWMIKSAKLVEDTDTAEVKELSDFFKPFEFTDDDYNRMLDFDRYVLYINSSSEKLSFVEYDEKVKAGEIIAPVLENEAETLEQIKTLLSEKGSILR